MLLTLPGVLSDAELAEVGIVVLLFAVGLEIPLPQLVQLLIGVEHRVAPQRSLGLKVGVWHSF